MSNQDEHHAFSVESDITATEAEERLVLAGNEVLGKRCTMVIGLVALASAIGATLVIAKVVIGPAPAAEAPNSESSSLQYQAMVESEDNTGCMNGFETIYTIDNEVVSEDCNQACVDDPNCLFTLFKTPGPTHVPTLARTRAPTAAPTAVPKGTRTPTAAPTAAPTASPTAVPSATPTGAPTTAPTGAPAASTTPSPTPRPDKPFPGNGRTPVEGVCYDGTEGGLPRHSPCHTTAFGAMDGWYSDCGDYDQRQWNCLDAVYTDDTDFSALDMCCGCGGGAKGCHDSDAGALDTLNKDCSDYDHYNQRCGLADWDDTDFSAKDMCCSCGGGVKGCEDTAAGALDGPGENCSFYESFQWHCDEADRADTDFSALDMCCICGGGSVKAPRPTYIPNGTGGMTCPSWQDVKSGVDLSEFCSKGNPHDDDDWTAADMCCVCHGPGGPTMPPPVKRPPDPHQVGICTLGRGVCEKQPEAGTKLSFVSRLKQDEEVVTVTTAEPLTNVLCGKGCSNWKTIMLDSSAKADSTTCEAMCKAHAACEMFNLQMEDFCEGMPGPGTCYIYGAGCQMEGSPCWTLFTKGR